MVYTSYEMIRDCRADKAEGWSYFVTNFVPVIQKLTTQYGGDPDAILKTLRDPNSSLFQSMAPAPERWFIAELRQTIAAAAPVSATADLDLATVADALTPLTLTEKQAAWFETMHFNPPRSAEALRMSAATVTKIRERAEELLRGKLDTWRRGMLVANGRALGLEAAAAVTKDCPASKPFLDILDGRSTWRGREELELHVRNCWHCVDHFCRMAEVIEILREVKPLTESEAAPYKKMLGIAPPKRRFWKMMG